MSQFTPVLTLPIIAAGAIVADRFVSVAATQAGAAANTLGVARSNAASGAPLPVDVMGTAIVEAGAAVAQYALLETNASGQAVTRSAGPIVGRALQAATAAGQRIEVLLIPN